MVFSYINLKRNITHSSCILFYKILNSIKLIAPISTIGLNLCFFNQVETVLFFLSNPGAFAVLLPFENPGG